MPETFHFLQPQWFWLLLPLALLIWMLRQTLDQSSAWRKLCDARLLPFLLSSQARRQSSLPTLLLSAGALLVVVALADPVWQQQEQPVFRNEAARVIVLDLSNSMLSPDLKPSRLLRARYKVADILKQELDGQTGLVVFAGDAFAVAPLTHDADTIQALLAPLAPGLMPVQGSRVDLGLLKAAELMQQAGSTRGDILLITDGYDGEQALDAAAQVNKDGYRVSVLAVGTDVGAPIPAGRGSFLRDSQGEVVIPALDQPGLRQLAAAGGGDYSLISGGGDDLSRLLSGMTAATDGQADQSGLTTDAWRSTGPWITLLLIPLAALAFRRGWLLGVMLLVGGMVSTPQPAMALGWDDLWLRADQQAERALQAGDAAAAAQLARNPDLRGTAAYQAGDFEAALQSFTQGTGVDADYNQGNALAQMQRYEEAIAAYDRALAQQPDMDDALHNKAVIEKLLQQQQEQQEQQDQQDQQDQQSQQDQQQGQGEQDQQNQQDQQQGQGEQQETQQGDNGESDDSRQAQQGEQGEPSDESDSDQQPSNNTVDDESQQSTESSSEQQQADAATDEQQNSNEETATADSENQGNDPSEADTEPGAVATADPLDSEEQRAAEQWLRRIPDDPAGLLRRKFQYQYNQRAAQPGTGGSQTW